MAISRYKTSDSIRWKAQVYLGKDKNGKQKRVKKEGFKTKKDAQQWEHRVRLQDIMFFEPKTFREVYDIWFEAYQYQVRESTLFKTTRLFEIHILPVFGETNIDDIKPYQVQRVINDWSTKYISHKKMAGYLKKIFAYAVMQDFIGENPFDKVIRPKRQVETKPDKNYWTKQELNLFVESCKDYPTLTYPIFRLLAYTGMRRQEILALTWEDFDALHGTISVNKALTRTAEGIKISLPKNKASEREIALDDETVEVLKAWRVEQSRLMLKLGYNTKRKDQIIFASTKNTHLSMPILNKWIKRICKDIGLRPITPHGFRHTHTSILLSEGVSIPEVQGRLGHADATTTLNIYAHIVKDQSEVANVFARAVNGK